MKYFYLDFLLCKTPLCVKFVQLSIYFENMKPNKTFWKNKNIFVNFTDLSGDTRQKIIGDTELETNTI